MGKRSRIRLGKNETIESTVLLGTSQNQYDHIIVAACNKYKVNPAEIKILLDKESGLNPRCIGRSGEYGIAQFMSKYNGNVDISNEARKRNEVKSFISKLEEDEVRGARALRRLKPTGAEYKELEEKQMALQEKIKEAKTEIGKIEKNIHAKMRKSLLGQVKSSIYLATKRFAERQKEYPGAHSAEKANIAHKTGWPILGAKSIKKRDELSKWAKRPEVTGDQIAEKYREIRWRKTAKDLQKSRLPHRRELVAKGTYDQLAFDKYIALGDRRRAGRRVGSLEKPHLVAVFTNKAKGKTGKEGYVIISKLKGKDEVYDNLDAVKERLYGKKRPKSKELALLTLDRHVVLGDGQRAKGKIGSLDNPHQVAVLKDKAKGQDGKEAYVIISKAKDRDGKIKHHRNFGESYDNLDAVKKRLYGAKGAKSKKLVGGEGKSLEKAKENLEKKEEKAEGKREVLQPEGPHAAQKRIAWDHGVETSTPGELTAADSSFGTALKEQGAFQALEVDQASDPGEERRDSSISEATRDTGGEIDDDLPGKFTQEELDELQASANEVQDSEWASSEREASEAVWTSPDEQESQELAGASEQYAYTSAMAGDSGGGGTFG